MEPRTNRSWLLHAFKQREFHLFFSSCLEVQLQGIYTRRGTEERNLEIRPHQTHSPHPSASLQEASQGELWVGREERGILHWKSVQFWTFEWDYATNSLCWKIMGSGQGSYCLAGKEWGLVPLKTQRQGNYVCLLLKPWTRWTSLVEREAALPSGKSPQLWPPQRPGPTAYLLWVPSPAE